MLNFKNRFILVATMFSAVNVQVIADVITRVGIQKGLETAQYFDLRLYEDNVPLTVANFLKYANDTTVNGGNYNNSFFHRFVPDFIIQTGGFSYDPADGAFEYDSINDTYPGGLSEIVEDDVVNNEFLYSNVAGTIAMAKKPNQVNSATSQWFINLVDNAANLDDQNGGFTVFGKIMGNGLDIINSIPAEASTNKSDIHPFFSQLPLISYSSGQTVDETKIVKITSITELIDITGDVDFGYVYTSTSEQIDIVIQNRSNTDVSVGAIGANDALAQPYTLIEPATGGCNGATLAAKGMVGDSCRFTIDFTSATEGEFIDSLDIDFPVLGINYILNVTGNSATVIEPDISPTMSAIDFGEVQYIPTSTFEQLVLYVHNIGNQPLEITSVLLTGRDAADYSYVDNCTGISPIQPGKFCVIPVNFVANSLGEKLATLTIVSNDSDESVLDIAISGVASEDTDGVPASIEDAVNANKDGNNDGLIDSVQSNVASIVSSSAGYMTIVSRNLSLLKNVTLDDGLDTAPLPDGANFKFGVLSFTLDRVNNLGSEEMGIILPENTRIDKVYAYGPTFDNTIPHWYEFDMREVVGATAFGTVTIQSDGGVSIKRSFILLRFFDGIRGDSDVSQNGKIVFRGAISVRETTDESGALDHMSLLAWLMFLITGRYFYISTKE